MKDGLQRLVRGVKICRGRQIEIRLETLVCYDKPVGEITDTALKRLCNAIHGGFLRAERLLS